MLVLPNFMGELKPLFKGKAEKAVKPALAYLNGLFKAFRGSDLRSTSVFIASRVSLNINLERSRVPKRLETAGNLLPLIFSNSIAGP